ncbi:MAG: cyclic nucleotide-binding domain-containing protein [Acidobacteria bacterium]|nr:cyclic nucleotide-binding domain-containing protein [Acidobacteriota bacterium]
MKSIGEAVVRVVLKGEFFGELACLDEDGTRTATAHAPRGATLLVVPKHAFLQVLRDFPDAGLIVLRQVAGRLRWHTDHLARTVSRRGLVQPEDRAARDKANRTWWQKIADWLIRFFARPICSIGHLIWWVLWFRFLGSEIPLTRIKMDVELLTNIVSLEAIVLAIAILVAQRRKEEKDQSREQMQFTNLAFAAEQSTAILFRIIELERALKYDRVKGRLQESPTGFVPHARS